jgi:hypothetical protein
MKASTRSLVLFLTLLVVTALAFTANAAKRKKAAAAATAPRTLVTTSSLPNCTAPGIQVQSDASGDQTGAPANSQLDITSVWIAELGTETDTLTITIKVNNLTGGPQINSTWAVFMNVADTTNTTRNIFFNMNTVDSGTGAVRFNYGYHTAGPPASDTSQGAGTVITGSSAADGTITLKINTANILNFNAIGGAHQFDVDLRGAGKSLTAIQGQTKLFVGAIGFGATSTIDSTTQGTGTYLTVGNAACTAPTPTPTPTPTSTPTPTPTPTPTATPVAALPRFLNYLSPQGVADSAGEPSIGSNWTKEAISHNTNINGSINNIPNGGTSLYFGGFLPAMAKVTWDDCSSPAGALWENKPLLSANTPRALGDPILFTDHDTGRTFCGQLEGGTPAGATIDITDNDGNSFTPSDGVIPSDIDHETIGGGPYHSSNPAIPHPLYPNAIYYASQSVGEARALRSDNGGLLFAQAAAPMYAINDCSGLHGHIKVSPADGTAFVPNRGCGGAVPFHETGAKQTLLVSENNGITWAQRPIPDSTTHGNGSADNAILGTHDPSVGVATDGTVYFGYQGADGHPRIAVSHDKGITWSASTDVGAGVVNGGPILNSAFPAVVAGDPNRAAFAFFGTETGGENWPCGQGDDCSADGQGLINARPKFGGVWYLYVATTFDGGVTWTTQNITPGDPIQRGGICGGSTCRNLLDFFDATIDKKGRVLIGYDDGCVTPQCINGDPAMLAGGKNDFTAKGAIARQSGGARMLAAFDPVEPTVPGAPAVVGGRTGAGDVASFSWPVPDNGGSPITGYNVYRKTGGAGVYSYIATVPVPNYTNTGLDPAVQYCYHVTAINGVGEGPYCPDFCPAIIIPPNICLKPGLPPGALVNNDLNPDGSDNDSGANTPPDPRVNIRQLFIAEPCFGGENKLVFTMQLAPSTAGSPPASSQWYIVWNRQNPDANFDRWYVAMKTDALGALSFEYGKFGVPTIGNPNVSTPMKLGDADTGSYNVATGVVTITLSNSKAENVGAGQGLAAVNVRTYLARPDAGTKTQSTASDITTDGTYTLSGNATCCQSVPFLGAVSRKTHGNAGTFDIGLPLIGGPGIECRSGGANGDYKVVFVFANPVTAVGGASVNAGSISSRSTGADPHEYVVNLTGVPNDQRVTVTLTGITDTAGNATNSLAVTMGVVIGDTTGNGAVNSSDISQTQSQSGQPVTIDNFREDVTVNGLINSSDIALVQSNSGTALP